MRSASRQYPAIVSAIVLSPHERAAPYWGRHGRRLPGEELESSGQNPPRLLPRAPSPAGPMSTPPARRTGRLHSAECGAPSGHPGPQLGHLCPQPVNIVLQLLDLPI